MVTGEFFPKSKLMHAGDKYIMTNSSRSPRGNHRLQSYAWYICYRGMMMGSLVMGNLLLGPHVVCFELLMCTDVLMCWVPHGGMNWCCLVVWDHGSLNWFSCAILYIEQGGTLNR